MCVMCVCMYLHMYVGVRMDLCMCLLAYMNIISCVNSVLYVRQSTSRLILKYILGLPLDMFVFNVL